VVRENVRAPDVHYFALGLETHGYGTVVVALEGEDFSASLRKRDFVVGCSDAGCASAFERIVHLAEGSGRNDSAAGEMSADRFLCFTASGCCGAKSYTTDNDYVYEDREGIRVLAPEEVERAMGFPAGWTAGAARTTRGHMVGNAVIPAMAEFIGRMIVEAEEEMLK